MATEQEQKAPYCTGCGKQEVLVPSRYFDRTTGKPTFMYVCKTYGCIYNSLCPLSLHNYAFMSGQCGTCGKYSS